MRQDLTTSSTAALPTVDVREPGSLLLLPRWLNEQVAAISDLGAGRTVVDPKTGAVTARVTTIPKSKMPTGPQRLAIQQRIEELHAAARPGPLPKTLQYVGQLVSEHAPSRLDEETASIKIDAYEDAVGDLPAWAVREAIRRWRRGEVSASADDLKFAPKPAQLRRIAQSVAAVATGQALRLQRILDAEPEEELSEAERAANQRRLAALIPDMRAGVEPERPSEAHVSAERLAVAEHLRALEEKRKSETEGAGA
jgi:hypothetical protein